MSRFVFGVFVGATLMFVALKYHVVRTKEGVQLVPKLTANFSEIYVDVREFGPDDWNQHRALATALVSAQKTDVIKDTSSDQLLEQAQNALDHLQNKF